MTVIITQILYFFMFVYTLMTYYAARLYLLFDVCYEKEDELIIYKKGEKSVKSIHHLPIIESCDLLVHYDGKTNTNSIYFDIPNKLNMDPVKCTFRFISLILVLDNGVKHELFSERDDSSFYVSGNVINLKVLQCLVMKSFSTYGLQIIDHQAEFLFLTEKDEIIFKRNTYEIKNNLKKID